MPQEFQILRCCDCEKFQVHQVKKAKRWQCKVCGLKQSMKRTFFTGSSKECRVNVQKLNFQAGEKEMMRKLGDTSSSVEDDNQSFEIGDKDIDFSKENEVNENDWIDENDWIAEYDCIDENDWIDDNDCFDENDCIEENPSVNTESLYRRNSQNDFEDELPRKKQRCESYSESAIAEEASNSTHSNEDVENQDLFSLIFNFKQDGNSSKQIASANISNTDGIPKMEKGEQECDSFTDREENPFAGVTKSRSNSLLKPNHGFQLILNEAKRQRIDLNLDLDL